MSLSVCVYAVCSRLPDHENYGLISQMKRCTVSIPSNIAEGSKRSTRKDFRQFIAIAKGSAAELETQLILTENIYGVADDTTSNLLKEVQKMLETLHRKLS